MDGGSGSHEEGEERRRALRILVVSKFYWPAPGGQSTVLRSLARSWARAGHRVSVLTTRSVRDSAGRAVEDGVRVRRIRTPRLDYVEVLWFMARTFLRVWLGSRPDVVVVSMLKHGAVAAIAAARLRGVPVVLRTEGGGPTGDVAWHDSALLGHRIRDVCRSADRVVAISGPIAEELRDAGFPERRVRFVPNCVTIPEVPWDPECLPARRAEMGLDDVPTLLFTGRLLVAKGLLDLVDALAALRRDGAEVQLVVAGEGRDRAAVEERIAARSLGRSVRLLGHVSDVRRWIPAADVFVLPSHVEGMSISLLEALASGIPVVASDIPANRALGLDSWITFHTVGDAAALADAIASMLRPPARGAAEAARCREDLRAAYGDDGIAARYLAEFDAVLADPAGTPRRDGGAA